MFKLISINVNGLHIHKLRLELTIRNTNTDVVCLQEVHKIDQDVMTAWTSELGYALHFGTHLKQKDGLTSKQELES